MNFKEYVRWCNDRACDGYWDMLTAMTCIDIIATLKKIPFWNREKVWKNEYENRVLEEIIDPINTKIHKELN